MGMEASILLYLSRNTTLAKKRLKQQEAIDDLS